MKHKLAKEICFLCPNSSLPKHLQVRPSHTPVPHFHYFHGHFYIVPPEIYHTPHWKWNCCLTPNPIPSPGILFCQQQHQLESDPGPRAHRTGIPLSLSLVGVTKPLLSLPKPASSCLSSLQFSYLHSSLHFPSCSPDFSLLQALQQSPKWSASSLPSTCLFHNNPFHSQKCPVIPKNHLCLIKMECLSPAQSIPLLFGHTFCYLFLLLSSKVITLSQKHVIWVLGQD